MEVRKLYYEESHQKEFTAVVTGCVPKGENWEVTLDATAFYPEGGGQACDLGTLGNAQVLDVQERDGDVIHTTSGPLTVGLTVSGSIDWQRRFDLMQQHSGEHMVSGVVHRRYGYHNVGFHMGETLVTVDFDGIIPPEDLVSIEREVNDAVWKNIALHCWIPSQQELPNVTYRTKRELPWPVRIVEIPGVDSCACCGVQVKQTGEVGLVKLFSCVKFHQGVRIEMACGRRAMELLSCVYEQNRLVSQAFSAKILETGDAARRMNEQLASEKFRSVGLQKQLFAAMAENCRGKQDVLYIEKDLTPAAVRELADAAAKVCSGVAAVLSGNDESGYSICLVSGTRDVRELGAQAAKELNGRGGGKPGAFQGNLKAQRSQIQVFFQNNLNLA